MNEIIILAIFTYIIIALFHYPAFFVHLSTDDIDSKPEFWTKLLFPPAWWVIWIIEKYREI